MHFKKTTFISLLGVFLSCLVVSAGYGACYPYDLDCDQDVDIVDVMLVASFWNTSIGHPDYDAEYDLDVDGDIDIYDIMIIATHWGWTSYISPPYKLPDTGQTQSYTNTFGEDSDYTINAPSFLDNGDGTVTDNNTAFMWQKEDDGTERFWENANSYCNNLSLAGYLDWRLPSKKELLGIVNYGSYPTYFSVFSSPNPSSQIKDYSFYWSSTSGSLYAYRKWAVDFYRGNTSAARMGSMQPFHLYTRCVRGSQYPSQNFTDNGDGTVTDNNTALMWQKEDDDNERTWEAAISYCEGLSLSIYSDWRLPNIKELESITDDSKHLPAIDTTYFPSMNNGSYWTSTTYTFDSIYAFDVHFNQGSSGGRGKLATHNSYSKCVRDVQ